MVKDVRLLRAARVLLGWSQAELAKKAGISRQALVSLETGRTRPFHETVLSVQRALEKSGIEFLPRSNAKGEGLRLSRNPER